MRCDLIMAIWNERDMTARALETIARTANFPYRLILVDNDSDEDTRAFLEEIACTHRYGETLLIRNDRNVGWLKATNQGLERADGDFVCLINNDIVAGTDWLRRMVATMNREPDIGLANPRGNERSENCRVRDVDAYAAELARRYPQHYTELDHVSGFCMLIKREVYQKIGQLDEVFEGGHYEDDDYSRRAQRLGYRCVQCDDAFVLHLGSVSFHKVPEERRRLIERNRRIYEERWGRRMRYLLWLRTGDCTDALALARQGHTVYLIAGRRCRAAQLPRPHANIRFLDSWFARLAPGLYFLLKLRYLQYKQRIDSAMVKIAP